MLLLTLLTLLACTASEPGDTGITEPTGEFCAPGELIGLVAVDRWGEEGTAGFSATVWDKPSPWIGEPAATSDHCLYQHYDVGGCTGCGEGTVCSAEGECVPDRRTDKETAVVLTADGVEHSFQADEQGYMWGTLGSEQSFSFDLTWSGGHVTTEALGLMEGLVATVTSQGSYEAPGQLDVSWSGSEDGHVRTVIPLNHHGGAPTFTQCVAEAGEAGFVVPAEMVDPLAIITGLEFQGLEHGQYASARTDAGCVQFAVSTHHHPNVQFP